MLILTRRIGERLIITTTSGDRIEVWPTESAKGQVKIAIEAPRSISVDRQEIHERKRKEAL